MRNITAFRVSGREEDFEEQQQRPEPVIVPPDLNDFPSLAPGGGSSSVPLTNIAPRGYTSIRSVARNGVQYDQHFPGLPGEAAAPPPPPPAAPSASVSSPFIELLFYPFLTLILG